MQHKTGALMPDDDLDYRQMRARVDKRVKKRAEFVLHFSIYVTANLVLWVFFLILSSRGIGGGKKNLLFFPLFATLFLGFGLVVGGVGNYFQNWGFGGVGEGAMLRVVAL